MRPSNLRYARVLLVEHDERLGRWMLDLFAGHVWSVQLSTSFSQASRVVNCGAPDIVIVDRRLPDGDGLVLCERLRTLRSGYVPVLMLTADPSSEECILALKRGVDDYMACPLNAMELLARAEALVRRMPLTADAANR